MRSFGAVVLAILLSGLIAGVVQLQLAISFNAHEEFIAAMMLLMLFVLVCAVAFCVALFTAKRVSGVNRTAIGLAVLLALAFVALEALSLSTGSASTTLGQDAAILAEIFIPCAIVILIQWWLVRRRWLKKATR
jgi:hypothetical protein